MCTYLCTVICSYTWILQIHKCKMANIQHADISTDMQRFERFVQIMEVTCYYSKCKRKEGNGLFNDALNTFYLWLYGVRHGKGPLRFRGRKPAVATWATLSGFFYMHHPTNRITHTTAFVTPVVEHWLEREIAQWVHPMKDRFDDPSHHERTLLPRSYISLLSVRMRVCVCATCTCI